MSRLTRFVIAAMAGGLMALIRLARSPRHAEEKRVARKIRADPKKTLELRTVALELLRSDLSSSFLYDLRFSSRFCRGGVLARWLAQGSGNRWNLFDHLPYFRADVFNEHLGCPSKSSDCTARDTLLSRLCHPASGPMAQSAHSYRYRGSGLASVHRSAKTAKKAGNRG
jgi:hypothetical protein